MRKIIIGSLIGLLMISSTCLAAGAGDDLKKLEKTGDRFVQIFGDKNRPGYSEYAKFFEKLDKPEAEVNKFVEEVLKESGPMMTYRLEDFHREPDHDNVGYILTCARRDRMIRVELNFSKEGKITMFRIMPLQVSVIDSTSEKR